MCMVCCSRTEGTSSLPASSCCLKELLISGYISLELPDVPSTSTDKQAGLEDEALLIGIQRASLDSGYRAVSAGATLANNLNGISI